MATNHGYYSIKHFEISYTQVYDESVAWKKLFLVQSSSKSRKLITTGH